MSTNDLKRRLAKLERPVAKSDVRPQPLAQLWAELEYMEGLGMAPRDEERDHAEADKRLSGVLLVLSDLIDERYRAEVVDWAEKYIAAYEAVEKWYA